MDVRARFLRSHSMLIRLDFPTFDRPIKAYSGRLSFGHKASLGKLPMYAELMISTVVVIYLFDFKLNIPQRIFNLAAKIRKKSLSSVFIK